MIPNLTEILTTTARNRLGVLYDRFGDDFPADRYIYLVSIINCDSGTWDEWLDDIKIAIKNIEDGYAIYKVFK